MIQFGITLFVSEMAGAKGTLHLRDCVQGAPEFVIAIYMSIRHIRSDVRSLRRRRLGP